MSEPQVAAIAEQPASPPPEMPAEVASSDQNVTESAPVEETKPDAQPEKPGHSRFERRISKLYRKLGEADARAKALEAELQSMKAPKSQPGEPQLTQFDDIEKYTQARAEWVAEQRLKDFQRKQVEEQQSASLKKLVSTWEEKASAASDKYDDFEEVVGDLKPTNPATAAIMSLENGDEVAYYLAKNVEEAKRIISIQDPLAQVLAIGRLSRKLESDPPVQKKPSAAPAPITPVSGKTVSASDEPSPEDDMRTWIKKRNRQVHGRK